MRLSRIYENNIELHKTEPSNPLPKVNRFSKINCIFVSNKKYKYIRRDQVSRKTTKLKFFPAIGERSECVRDYEENNVFRAYMVVSVRPVSASWNVETVEYKLTLGSFQIILFLIFSCYYNI